MTLNKLVVLDVEGTIRDQIRDEKTKKTRIQHQDLEPVFKKLKSLGCEIVIASNLDTYDSLRKEFKKIGIDQYITHYEPDVPGEFDKPSKMERYIEGYLACGVDVSPEQIRFYDDSERNIDSMIWNGYEHSYLVNNAKPETSLLTQLTKLLHELESEGPMERA